MNPPNFFTEHGSMTALPWTKFEKDVFTENVAIDNRLFVRYAPKTGFGQIWYLVMGPLLLEEMNY